MMKQMQEENKRLAREKKERENQWKNHQEKQNQFEITNVNNSHLMTENPGTTQSQLAPHRYVPYHFKGLNPDQKDNIMEQRAQQLRDAKLQKQREQEEEQLWAMQQEANRQLMLQNELELQAKQQQMVGMHKTQHKQDKVEKNNMWPNYYGDQNPLPPLQ